MSDFEKWWVEFSAGEKHLEMADKHVAMAAWDYPQQTIDQLQQRVEALEKALREIAEQGCKSSFDDDQAICGTLPGYDRENWCNPCLANAALLQEPTK